MGKIIGCLKVKENDLVRREDLMMWEIEEYLSRKEEWDLVYNWNISFIMEYGKFIYYLSDYDNKYMFVLVINFINKRG